MKDSTETTLTRNDVKIREKKRAHDGYFKIDRYQLQHQKFDGSTSALLSREVLERGHVIAVLPIDIQRKKVVLIEQFRPGAYAAGWHPWLLECVAGIIESGESDDAVAHRESSEETGCTLQQLLPIQQFLSSPGASSETVKLYIATTDSSTIGGIHGVADEGEDIRVQIFSFEDAVNLLDHGKIVNAKTVIALQWLARYQSRISADWFEQAVLDYKKLNG